jgi:hypothetical protein
MIILIHLFDQLDQLDVLFGCRVDHINAWNEVLVDDVELENLFRLGIPIKMLIEVIVVVCDPLIGSDVPWCMMSEFNADFEEICNVCEILCPKVTRDDLVQGMRFAIIQSQ